MSKISIGGDVGGDVAGGSISKTGNSSGDDGNGLRWLVIAVIATTLVAGLAWGTNAFRLRGSGWGVEGESGLKDGNGGGGVGNGGVEAKDTQRR